MKKKQVAMIVLWISAIFMGFAYILFGLSQLRALQIESTFLIGFVTYCAVTED